MKHLFLCAFCAFIVSIFLVNHYFFKHNHHFHISHLYTYLPPEPWNFEKNSLIQKSEIDTILAQPYHYLNKGHQSIVFASQDGKYVLKFYHFPSHLRPVRWLKKPFCPSKKQKMKQEYNRLKLQKTLASYRTAFESFSQESAILVTHLSKSENFKKCVLLKDALQCPYFVSLDDAYFVLQKKGRLLFVVMQELIEKNQWEEGKKIIDEIFTLIRVRREKKIRDEDAILEKNYGWLDGRVFQIDIGSLKPISEGENMPSLKEEIANITEPLKNWLSFHNELLLNYYQQELDKI